MPHVAKAGYGLGPWLALGWLTLRGLFVMEK